MSKAKLFKMLMWLKFSQIAPTNQMQSHLMIH